MTLPPLPDNAVRLGVAVDDWRAAIRASGDALVAAGATLDAYTDRMIQVIDEFGSYIVIAPGLALAPPSRFSHRPRARCARAR